MEVMTLVPAKSAAADFNTAPILLNDSAQLFVQVVFTGADVVGTLTLEASADATSWITVQGSSQAVTASTNHVWDDISTAAKYVRVAWDYTSGTGNIEIKAVIKNPAGVAISR